MSATDRPAATNTPYYLRPSAADLGEMPLDLDVLNQACAGLSARQLACWTRLVRHLWCAGELPATPRRLAEIAGVGVKAFEAMMPALAPLFDHDRDGRWTDELMVQERNLRLDLSPDQRVSFEAAGAGAAKTRAVDEALSDKRREAGRAGAEKRWGRRARLQVLQGGRQDGGVAAAEGNSPAFAKGTLPSADSKTDGKEAIGDPVDLPCFLPSSLPSGASHADGSIDRTESSGSLEETEEPNARTNAPGAGAGGGQDGKTAAEADGKTGHGKGGDDKTPDLSDAAIVAALRDAGGPKVPAHVVTASSLGPVRELIELGCDFRRDVVPAFRDGVRGLNEPLRTLKAGFLKTSALANLAEAQRTEAVAAAADARAEAQVFVERDSPEWKAWLKRLGRKSFPTVDRVIDGVRRTGWPFDKRWPSGAEPAEELK